MEPLEQPIPEATGLRRMFAAFQYPNYRLYFIGQSLSLIGTWMQGATQGYLVFELTHSPASLGWVAFASGMPAWAFMLYGGVVADRVPKRRLMIATQSAMMGLALTLALLTLAGWIRPLHILALSVALGVVNAFDAPVRSAILSEMVQRDDLANAIAMNSTMINIASALGPALSGIIYPWLGPGACFLLNALSYVTVITALLLMKGCPSAARDKPASALAELGQGLRFVSADSRVRGLMLLVVISTVFGFASTTLMPAWAQKVLGGDATTNGLLMSSRGLGSLCGALIIASLGRFRFRAKLLFSGALSYPIFFVLFAQVRWLPLSLFLIFLAGVSLIFVFAMTNTLVQTLSPDALRGRVMGVYNFAFFGFLPLGGLLAGSLAERFGEPSTLLVLPLIALGGAIWVVAATPHFLRLH